MSKALACHDNNVHDEDLRQGVMGRFVQSFWKGITLPFPALGKIALHPDFTDTSKIASVGLSLREGLVILAGYLAIGVVAYSVVLERWTIVDALYF
jgi:hypothetical protein